MSPASALGGAGAQRAASLFAALGDETRLRLVARMSAHGPESIARLQENCGVTRQAISKHLQVLARAGLARGRSRGRERIWELQPKKLAAARGYLECVSREWDEALQRLRGLVEG